MMDPRITAMSADLRRAELAAEAAERRRVTKTSEEAAETPQPAAPPRPVRRAATA
jgi:hypothetical protein